METFSTLIFIGNGFDMAAGIDTSYKSFYQSQYFQELVNRNNSIANHIDEVNKHLQEQDPMWWANLEKELYKYSKHLIEYYDDEEIIEMPLKAEFEGLKKALFLYLHRAITTKDKDDYFLRELVGLWLSEDKNTYFINFNYTNVLNDVTKNNSNIMSVHGNIFNHANPDMPIVVGIDESQHIDDVFNFFYKSNDDSYNITGIGNLIKNAKRYILFGCSMGDSDAWYFKTMLQNCSGKHIEINYYSDKAKDNYKRQLHKLFGKGLSDLQDLTSLQFTDCKQLSNIKYQRENYYRGHPQVNNLIQQLKESNASEKSV